ncbi:unnamed protein product [Peniophora sp. CBMAI 1063]|nr:unnamed protein product [Peniophora sp. CBMAI 1063]
MSTSVSPPSLVYSSSSGPTSSPPQTPPRRARTMYPAGLGKAGEAGRVPLHRRGTSRTYERLEDLLREAGYKETRVVTPQKPGAGMDDGDDEENDDGKDKRGGVMKFLSGLVAGRSVEEGRRKREERESWSVPASPSARIRRFADENENNAQGMSDGEGYSPRGRTRTQPQAGPSRTRTQTQPQTNYQHPLHASPRSAQPDLQPLTRTTSTRNPRVSHLLPPERVAIPQHPTYAQASPARAMLRHMASAPSMARTRSDRGVRRPPPRSQTHAVDLTDAPSPSSSYHTPPQQQHRRKKSAPDPTEPPLPATWLESVARALLGVPGAHVGRPQSPVPASDVEDDERRVGGNISASASEVTIRPAKSGSGSLSRAGSTLLRQGLARQGSTISALVRADSTSSAIQERGRTRARPPAALLLGASLAATAEASRTRVVCRSAPGSRATSRVREEPGSVRGFRKVAPAPKKTKAQSPLPSPPAVSYPLPRARGTGTAPRAKDSSRRRTGRKSEAAKTRHPDSGAVSLSLHGHAEGEAFEWSSEASSSSESEGAGREVDLGMLLRAGSPRRQASVQSLRRHLSMSSSGIPGETEGKGKRRRGIPREWADGD